MATQVLQTGQTIKTNENTYQIQQKIGEGQFGKVFLAYSHLKQEFVAIKQVKKFDKPKIMELFQNEIQNQSNLNSKHIVAIKDFIDHTESNTYLVVQEYCQDGDLQNYIEKNGPIPEKQAVAYLKQLLAGFKDMHQKKCIHRDVKASNILLHRGQVKLSDFGFSRQLNEEEIASTMLGTYITMAPEVFNQQTYGFEADLYSLGVVFYQMLFKNYPFKSQNPNQLFALKKLENIQFDNVQISLNAQDLIKKMLKSDRNKRIKWEEIYQHPLIYEEQDLPENIANQFMIASFCDFDPVQIENKKFYENDIILKRMSFNDKDNFITQTVTEGAKQLQISTSQSGISSQQEMDQLQKEMESFKMFEEKKNKDIEEGYKKYMHKRNLYGILVQMLEQIRNLKEFKINYQIPAFLTCKKLLKMIKDFIFVLQKKQNIFGMFFFHEFQETKQYADLINYAKSDLSLIRSLYTNILQECKTSIKKLKIKNKILNSHLESQECNENFDESYKACLINYTTGLREQQNDEESDKQRKLFNHICLVSDIARIDSFEKDNYDFDFSQYKCKIQSIPFSEFNSKLNESCQKIFEQCN